MHCVYRSLRSVDRRPDLSLNEWAVLGLLAERPRHGYDIAAELKADQPLGEAWRVSRALVYRALERLDDLGLVEPKQTEPGDGGPPRTVYRPTRTGRARVRAWLEEPVTHLRDVRSALLLKLLLLDRLGVDRAELVRRQRAVFAEAFEQRPPPSADVVHAWRHESAQAVRAFLDRLG